MNFIVDKMMKNSLIRLNFIYFILFNECHLSMLEKMIDKIF
jgi:hypothetical protein